MVEDYGVFEVVKLSGVTSAMVILEAPAMSVLKFLAVPRIIRFPAVSAFQALMMEKSPRIHSSRMHFFPSKTLRYYRKREEVRIFKVEEPLFALNILELFCLSERI